ARRLFGVAGVDAGGEASLGEATAQAQVAGLACGARRFDATRTARQPRIEHDPLAGFDAPRVGADFLHGGDELVAEHLWARDERPHQRPTLLTHSTAPAMKPSMSACLASTNGFISGM